MSEWEWTWDPVKASRNRAKHGLSFTTAIRVFDDPAHLTIEDCELTEQRFQTLGMVGGVVLLVVHTWPMGATPGRIISGRKATARERRIYHGEAR